MENPTPSAHAILARLLRALEAPDCHCRPKSYCPECGASGPCIWHCGLCQAEWPDGADRCPECLAASLRLPCPRADRPRPEPAPCPHVREHGHNTPLEEWQALLWVSDRGAYAEPDQALWPTACLPGSPGKVEAMAARHESGLSLWHSSDGDPTIAALDTEEVEVSRGKNGAVIRGDLRQRAGKETRHAG